MNVTRSIGVLESYLHSQISCAEEMKRVGIRDVDRHFITISRQTGSGGITIGQKLVRILNGTVGNFPARDRAVKIATDTDGVRSVRNQIMVNTNL